MAKVISPCPILCYAGKRQAFILLNSLVDSTGNQNSDLPAREAHALPIHPLLPVMVFSAEFDEKDRDLELECGPHIRP